MKLNKDVCMKCRDMQVLFKDWNSWTDYNTDLWDRKGKVVCPSVRASGSSARYIKIDKGTENCPFKLEHMVLEQK